MFIIESLQISFISSKVSPSHPAFVAKISSVFPLNSTLYFNKNDLIGGVELYHHTGVPIINLS